MRETSESRAPQPDEPSKTEPTPPAPARPKPARQIVFAACAVALASFGYLGVRAALPADTTAPMPSEAVAAPDDSIEELLPPPIAALVGDGGIIEMTFDIDASIPHKRAPHGPRPKRAPPPR